MVSLNIPSYSASACCWRRLFALNQLSDGGNAQYVVEGDANKYSSTVCHEWLLGTYRRWDAVLPSILLGIFSVQNDRKAASSCM